MELALTACHFCQKATFKYTCPKCNALYCGQSCFRKHKQCTSSFYNIFLQSSYSEDDRNDIIMRYVAMKNSIQIDNKTPERAESESSMESESIWTNDDYVPPRLVAIDIDSDDDSYPYYDYAYDSSDEGDELNDEGDDSNNDGNDDRDVSNDNDNNNGDDSNANSNDGGDLGNHVGEDSIADGNHNGAGGNAIKDSKDSNVNDDDNENDLTLEVD